MPQSIHAFAEKIALITNGTSRIGRAIALQLAMQGAFVTVGYSDASAVELMKHRPKARIVNVVSACDTAEPGPNPAFSMTQAAIADLTKTLAGSLPKKFRVNCVRVSEKGARTAVAGNSLFELDKGVTADDVARAVVYLLSGEAVGVNGQILTVE